MNASAITLGVSTRSHYRLSIFVEFVIYVGNRVGEQAAVNQRPLGDGFQRHSITSYYFIHLWINRVCETPTRLGSYGY